MTWAMGGISRETLRKWLERGASGEEPYRSFGEAAMMAMAAAESESLQIIQNAAQYDWHASAWILVRRWRSRWQKRHNVSAAVAVDIRAEVRAVRQLIEDPVLARAALSIFEAMATAPNQPALLEDGQPDPDGDEVAL